MSKEIKYTDAVPNSIVTRYKEDNIQYLLDQVARLTAENAMLKEKWSTSKPEQEPVAWIIVNKETGYRTQVSDLTPFLYHREIFEVIPLYTAPPVKSEQEPVGIVRTIGGYPDNSEHIVEWLCKYKDLKEGDRLYLAPQTHKPITGIEISNAFKADDEATHPYSYWAGVDFAEKHHGIGGGE